MTQITPPQTADLLAAMADIKASITLLTGETRLHTEILTHIVQMLTPAEERSGPGIHEVLAALIGRLDRQSVMLKEMIDGQETLRLTLPRKIARTIADALEEPGKDANENVEAAQDGPQPPHGTNGGHHHP